MIEITSEARALAEKAFQDMPPLPKGCSALLLIGLGSGALLDRILHAYAHPLSHPKPPNEVSTYWAPEYNHQSGMSIWLFEPDADRLSFIYQHPVWKRAVEIGQLQLYFGHAALDALEEDINYPPNYPITNWISSPDADIPPQNLQLITSRIARALERRHQTLQRLSDAQRLRENRWEMDHPGISRRVGWRETYTPGRKLKIIVIGLRFGGFTGHSLASLSRAFQRLGHEVTFLEPVNNFQMMVPLALQRVIFDFSPDLIVAVNYPRHHFHKAGLCTDGIPYACWLQDPGIFNELQTDRAVSQRNELDFYFSCSKEWSRQLELLGYGSIPIVKVPTDPELYSLTPPPDWENPSSPATVSYVATVPGEVVREIFSEDISPGSSPKRKLLFQKVFKTIDRCLARGEMIQSHLYQLLLDEYLQTEKPELFASTQTDEKAKASFLAMLENKPGRVALRSAAVSWLADAGFDLALYGDGWQHHPQLKRYDCGWIPYGRPLADMLRSSAIHLCIHNLWTLTMKVLDCLATGTLPLVNWTSPERDTGPITEWFQEDRDIILFRTKEELLDKVRYYLAHPDERKQIALRGREIALKHFTYSHAAAQMLDSIRTRLNA